MNITAFYDILFESEKKMGQLVPTQQTICNDLDFIKSFINVYQQLFNSLCSRETVYIILAQHYVETGNLNTYNWNIANIKYNNNPNDQTPYCILNGVFEYINGVKVSIPPGAPGSLFRAFNTLDEGMTYYLQFITNNRYKDAYTAAVQGDIVGFATKLREAGYYTAPLASYLQYLQVFYNKFAATTLYEQALDASPAGQSWQNAAGTFSRFFTKILNKNSNLK